MSIFEEKDRTRTPWWQVFLCLQMLRQRRQSRARRLRIFGGRSGASHL